MLHLSLEPCHQSVRLVTSGDPRLANCDLAICRHPGSGLSLQERLPFRQRGLESRCEDGGSSAQTSPAVQFQSQHLTMFGYCYYLQSTSRPRQSSQWQLIAAAVHFLGFIVCLSSLSPRPHYPGSRSGGPQQQSCSEGRARACAGSGRRCPVLGEWRVCGRRRRRHSQLIRW